MSTPLTPEQLAAIAASKEEFRQGVIGFIPEGAVDFVVDLTAALGLAMVQDEFFLALSDEDQAKFTWIFGGVVPHGIMNWAKENGAAA